MLFLIRSQEKAAKKENWKGLKELDARLSANADFSPFSPLSKSSLQAPINSPVLAADLNLSDQTSTTR